MGTERGFYGKPSQVALHLIIAVQQQSVFVLLSAEAAFLKFIALLSQNVHGC